MDKHKKVLEDLYREYQNEFPIHKRISNREINNVLGEELQRNNINIDFRYGTYNVFGDKLKSGYFTINPEKVTDIHCLAIEKEKTTLHYI